MSTLAMFLIATFLWFIWKQLEEIARALIGLHKIAQGREHGYLRDTERR